MKKISVYLIIALFLVSFVPETFSEEEQANVIAASGNTEVGNKLSITDASNIKAVQGIEQRKLTVEQIRANQKEKLMTAVEKCKENNLDSELCEKKLQNRIQLVEKLKEKDLTRLQKVEERKIQKAGELNEIKNNPALLKYKTALAFKARKISKEKLIKAKENYLAIKEKYQTARENYLTAQNKFNETKQKLGECKDVDSEECNQLREQAQEDAKEFLLKTADNIIEHLNKVKSNIESNEDLSEEEASETISEIDGMIKEIEDAKAAIESSSTKEEILEAAKTIKQAWLKVKKRLVLQAGIVVNARIGGVVVKAKSLEVKLERILGRMEEKGIDTSEVQALVDDFNSKIAAAKENYEKAVEKFKEAKSASDAETANSLAVEGHQYMKDAQAALQEAQKSLRDIVLKIKQSGGEEELTASEDAAEGEVESEEVSEGGESK